MDYKGLLVKSNTVMVVMAEAMVNMGLDIDLIWTQMANAYQGDAKEMLSHMGVNIEGKDVQSVTESFAEQIKATGAVQRCNVVSASDDEVVVDIGECIYAPATAKLREHHPDDIPPCPFMAILYAGINEHTGKHCHITDVKHTPEHNSNIFTLEVE